MIRDFLQCIGDLLYLVVYFSFLFFTMFIVPSILLLTGLGSIQSLALQIWNRKATWGSGVCFSLLAVVALVCAIFYFKYFVMPLFSGTGMNS
jgi:hypothetical protein